MNVEVPFFFILSWTFLPSFCLASRFSLLVETNRDIIKKLQNFDNFKMTNGIECWGEASEAFYLARKAQRKVHVFRNMCMTIHLLCLSFFLLLCSWDTKCRSDDSSVASPFKFFKRKSLKLHEMFDYFREFLNKCFDEDRVWFAFVSAVKIFFFLQKQKDHFWGSAFCALLFLVILSVDHVCSFQHKRSRNNGGLKLEGRFRLN